MQVIHMVQVVIINVKFNLYLVLTFSLCTVSLCYSEIKQLVFYMV